MGRVQDIRKDSLKARLLHHGLFCSEVPTLDDDLVGVNVYLYSSDRVPYDTVWIDQDGGYVYGHNFEYDSEDSYYIAEHYVGIKRMREN